MRIKAICFFISVFLVLWLVGLQFSRRSSLWQGNPHNQYTLQVEAWLDGHLDIGNPPQYLEIASYAGKNYVSFPPTPSFIELPFHVFSGGWIPNGWPTVILLIIAGILLIEIFSARGFGWWWSSVFCLSFIFGSNLYNGLAQQGVWHFAQAQGFSLALISLLLMLSKPDKRRSFLRRVTAYVALSLAVGCRPFYLFYFPFLCYLDWLRLLEEGETQSGLSVVRGTVFFIPYIAVIATYNFVRFDNVFEFGHNYLANFQLRPQFDRSYFLRNFWHSFVQVPIWTGQLPYVLKFDWMGTGFWINNPWAFLGFGAALWGFWQRSSQRSLFACLLFTIMIVWLPLLMHESNGWTQFGYRYMIDLLPLAALALLLKQERLGWAWLIAISVFAVGLNLYGIALVSR